MGDPFAFETRRLSSGAQLFHQHRPGLQWTGVVFIILAGHMHDEIGKEGTAHLLEHFVSTGSIGPRPALPRSHLDEWIQDQEMSVNLGMTDLYSTRYGGRVLNGNAQALFDFMADLVFRPGLDGDFEHDREIVRAERKQEKSEDDLRIEVVRKQILYGEHRRATCTGLPEDRVLDSITHEDASAFHRRFYGVPNLRVVTLGGLTTEEVLLHLHRSLPDSTPSAFEPMGPVSPLPLIPFLSNHEYLKMRAASVDTGNILQWHWKLPIEMLGVSKQAATALRIMLEDTIREQRRAAYSVRVESPSSYDHAQFRMVTKVAPRFVGQVREEVERALKDADGVRKLLPRIRRSAGLHMRFAEQTSQQIIAHAVYEVAARGRIATQDELLREIINATDDDVISFVEDRLSINSSFFLNLGI